MKVIQHSLKSLDFFGPKINFTIKREPSFRSVLGGSVSLIVYCLYIFFFLLFGKDMIFKLNPNVTWEIVNPEKQESYQISNETFFAWRVEDFYGNYYNATDLFNVNMYYEVYDNYNNNIVNYTFFKTLNCNDKKFEKNFENSIYNKTPNQWNCYDFSEKPDKHLFGSVITNQMSYLFFVLDICAVDFKKKGKFNCKDFRKVRKILSENELVLRILYYDTVLKPNDYEAPLQRELKSNSNFLNVNQMTTQKFYFQNSIIEQDIAFLFTNEKPLMNIVSINNIESSTNFKTDEELDEYYKIDRSLTSFVLYTVFFHYDQPYKKYLRKYMKVQDVFGNVNGFMEFLILIFNLINYYTIYRFDYFLFKELVNVKIDKADSSIIKGENELKKVFNRKNRNNNNENNKDKQSKSSNISKLNIKSSHDLPIILNFDEDNDNDKNININEIKFKTQSASERKNICDLRESNLSSGLVEDNNTLRKLMIKPVSELCFMKDISVNNSAFKENFKLDENIKKLIKEKIQEGLYTQTKTKVRYLEPDFLLYYCKSKNKKKAFDLELLKTYSDKINEKFEVFYYLNLIRQFKNLKKFLFKEKNESTIFKLLASNVYDITISHYNQDYFNKEKKLKNIIEEWVHNLKHIKDGDLSHFTICNLINNK